MYPMALGCEKTLKFGEIKTLNDYDKLVGVYKKLLDR